MAKTREFKNVESVSIFRPQNRCYVNIKGKPRARGYEKCKIIEIRNVDVSYSRDMPSASLVNFRKPVTCYHNAEDELLFCGEYKVK